MLKQNIILICLIQRVTILITCIVSPSLPYYNSPLIYKESSSEGEDGDEEEWMTDKEDGDDIELDDER